MIDSPCFPTLSMLAKLILSLPQSNTEVERVFSIVNDVWMKHLIQSQSLDHHFKTKIKRVYIIPISPI